MDIHGISRRFFLFDRFIGANLIGNGNINDTYRVDFEQTGTSKSAILQRLNHRVFTRPETVMGNTLRVCEHLASAGYPYKIAAPLPASDGRYLHQDAAGNYWRASPFFENSFAPEGLADPNIAYEAARAYGAFARALRDFPAQTLMETIPGFHDTNQRWAFFLTTLKSDPLQRAQYAQPEIEALFAAKPIFDLISYLKKTAALPLRVAHNDTKAGNVLFDRSSLKAIAVIDLDTVMPGSLLSDFGDMVRSFTPDCAEDAEENPILRKDVLNALTTGFMEETSFFLTTTERENLMLGAEWMVAEQALRFLTDWLAGDVYFKVNGPTHNLIRSRNQLALLGQLLGGL